LNLSQRFRCLEIDKTQEEDNRFKKNLEAKEDLVVVLSKNVVNIETGSESIDVFHWEIETFFCLFDHIRYREVFSEAITKLVKRHPPPYHRLNMCAMG